MIKKKKITYKLITYFTNKEADAQKEMLTSAVI